MSYTVFVCQVYVSLSDEEGAHWFLLVINVVKRKNYILDSLGVSKNCFEIISELVSKTYIYGLYCVYELHLLV